MTRKSPKVKPEELSEYLDGRLSGKSLERVERILASSAEAREELESLRATVNLMRQLPVSQPRRSFVMAAPPVVMEPVAPIKAKARPWLPLRAPQWSYAAAASVAALAFSVLLSADITGALSRNGEPEPTAVSDAPLMAPESDSFLPESYRSTTGAEKEPTPAPFGEQSPQDQRAGNDGNPPQAAEGTAEDSGSAENLTAGNLTSQEPVSIPLADTSADADALTDSEESTPLGWRALQGALAAIGLGAIAGLIIKWRQSRQTSI